MTAVVTLASAARLTHVERQQERLKAADDAAQAFVVWLDETPPPPHLGRTARTLHLPPGADGLRLAAGRNLGARAALTAGHELLVFLDADCVPGPDLLEVYAGASTRHPDALLCGPVTYLPEGIVVDAEVDLDELTAPHPARPVPAAGATVAAAATDYALFWSLSFAASSDTWEAVGGFDEAYEGYGGEDTDFAFRARERGVPLVWTGGAHAYHQYHPTSSPPWQHLDDILRNGALFAERWGVWPMEGWLERFAAAGAVEWTGETWRRTD